MQIKMDFSLKKPHAEILDSSRRLFENAHPSFNSGTKFLALLNRLRRLAFREFNRARNEAHMV